MASGANSTKNNKVVAILFFATRQRNTFFSFVFFSVRTPSRGDIRRQPSMARDEENERGKIGAEVNEMQRMERLERKRDRERQSLVEIRLLV